jgi:hypothetical protein
VPSKNGGKRSKAHALLEEGTLNPAGQVRNAAPRFRREGPGDECRGTIRGIQTYVLSSQGKLRGDRNRGACTKEARSAQPPQASRQSFDVSPDSSRAGRADPRAKAGCGDSAGVRYRRASKDDRASAWRKKNSEVKPGAMEKSSVWHAPSILAQYETLRMAALGEPLPPESRSGLGLFLRRGMWAWVRAVADARNTVQPTCSLGLTSIASHQRKSVIQIFAAMALNTDYRRAQ